MNPRATSYDLNPSVEGGAPSSVAAGFAAAAAAIMAGDPAVVVIDVYPGVASSDVARLVETMRPAVALDTAAALHPPEAIDRLVAADLTDDPVFGHLTKLELSDFFDPVELAGLRRRVERATGPGAAVVVHGIGASLVADGDVVVYADLPRREAHLRQRRGEAANLGAANIGTRPGELYKRSYFVDWPVADRHKWTLWPRIDWLLGSVEPGRPLLVEAEAVRQALTRTARRPFRVVPWFDPAPWGGTWIERVCGLPPGQPNYGWCFDCVPEENSLTLRFGDRRLELPALDLVNQERDAVLGAEVVDRFGAEFPIRFDFLDTMGGGNLSLQVHPRADYIADHFGLGYTQDESYYLLDAEPGASVFLGFRSGADPAEMAAGLRAAQQGHARGPAFDAERFVNRWPASAHDHFLIPAGTVHCSGAGAMVLEISATPSIFTFKLWDWGRTGLDGRPRPTHVEHGLRNICFERDTAWTRANLVGRVTPLDAGPGWRSERTGLHEAEFIETHRHWFTGPVTHSGSGGAGGTSGVNVLNLVAGEVAVVTSPDAAFEPFEVHYAETFVVPAAAGPFTLRPVGPPRPPAATIKAFVRAPR